MFIRSRQISANSDKNIITRFQIRPFGESFLSKRIEHFTGQQTPINESFTLHGTEKSDLRMQAKLDSGVGAPIAGWFQFALVNYGEFYTTAAAFVDAGGDNLG